MSRLKLGVVLIACVGAILGAGVVWGQVDPVPPQVIGVQPYPGEEMRLDQPLTIVFNQAMDQASVESAWSIEPAVEGQFQWTDDKTLIFGPRNGWERSASYEVRFATSAAAQNGLTLSDEYHFTVRAVGDLLVSSVIPADGVEGVAANATITVAFNRPVVPLGSTEDLANLPNPLVFEPAVEGKGEWLNTSIYQFTPTAPLLGGASYMVTVKAGLTDFSGATLAQDYVFSFQTLVPEIFSTTPYDYSEGVLLDSTMQVVFSQPMDTASVEGAFKILDARGEPLLGSYEWSSGDTVVTFTPAQALTIESEYRFMLDGSQAKGLGGATVRAGRDFTFRTVSLPFIRATYPSDGESDISPGSNSVYIEFGTPMKPQSFENKYIISPQPSDEVVPYASEYSLSLSFNFLPQTVYTITVVAGTEDIYGNQIQNNYVFSFATGQVQPYAYLQDSGSFVVTGGYREDTALPIQVGGEPTLYFELYNLPPTDLYNAVWNLYDETVQARLTDQNRMVRQWGQTFGGDLSNRTEKVNLLSEDGGALPLGIYFLQARFLSPDGYENEMPVSVAVTNSTVTYKRASGDLLVWVTDMQTGEPLADQTVKIYYLDSLIATGQTDAEGVLRLEMGREYDSAFLSITSESTGRFGVWYNTYTPYVPDPNTIYLYTDRPIYRPGETVYFRGVYRVRDDVNFNLNPSRETLDIMADVNYGERQLLQETVILNQFGAFSGEFVIPEDAPIGQLRIYEVSGVQGEISAQIAEFRVPEFSVTVTPSQDEIISADPQRVMINGAFFSGGSVSNAPITWYANASQTNFNYRGSGRYSFSDSTYNYYYYMSDCFDCYGYYGYNQRTLGSGEGMTDGSGNFLVELDPTATTTGGAYPEAVTVEATLTDESGQFISGRSSFIIHPSEVYVGVRTTEYFGKENQPLVAEVITVNPQSEAVSQHNVMLKLIERRWERTPIEGVFGQYSWSQREIEVESVTVTTDDNGLGSYTFTPPNAGIFIVRAETRDDRERLHVSTTQVWVTGETYVWWGQPSNTIDLVADKESYTPGDTAQILVPVSLEGTSYLLIALERQGVMSYEVREVQGSTFVYELPIEELHAPNIHVSVMVMHGIDADNLVPTFRTGLLTLAVEPVHKLLNVAITPSDDKAQPGDTVTLDILVTNPDGTPAQAELGVAMVDQAIRTLAAPNSTDPQAYFYGYAADYTVTDTMLTALVDRRLDAVDKQADDEERLSRQETDEEFAMTDGIVANEAAPGDAATRAPAPTAAAVGQAGAEMGGGGFENVTVRENFQQTPLWSPHVVTDSDGRAQVEVTLPDNLTQWYIFARAVTQETLVGSQETMIQSTLPLLVRPATPRFFVVGDEVTLAMVVNNNTSADQTVRTTMQGTGFELLEGETLEKEVTIEADGRARVEWNVKILDVQGVDLTFIALGADGYQDAAKPPLATGENGTIPVYRYTAPDTTGTGGVLRQAESVTEGVSIPPFADTDQGTLTIQLDPSLAVTTIDALDYLENFPHQCIEQTVSRFLPNIMTYRALQQLGVSDPELEAKLRAAVDFGVRRLAESQNLDGGWGWFQNMTSNPFITAYAVLGLVEARNAGFDVNINMLDRAIPVILADIKTLNEDSDTWVLNRQAFYFYVLSRYENARPAVSDLDKLFDLRLEMSDYAQAYLLMAYLNLAPEATNQSQALQSDLITRAKLSATGAHWEEAYSDWWNWNTDVRSTAIVLSALIKANPNQELLPNVVRWLMVARKGSHWETTQDTTWSVMALTDWMVATNELQGNYSYGVSLNGAEWGTGTVTPDTVRQGQTLVVEVGDLLLDEINRVSINRGEGDGALYYTAHLRLRLDASEVEAIDRGVSVTREYFVNDSTTPSTEATMGDIITVRLTITVPETIYYFVLEDPLPAGTEALDTSLLTTTQAITGPQLTPQYNPYYWWWWWIWDHTEIRDESVNLYADELYPGTYVYSYQVQATVPGKFQTMPSHAYAFYFPEVFGRSDGVLFVVNKPEE